MTKETDSVNDKSPTPEGKRRPLSITCAPTAFSILIPLFLYPMTAQADIPCKPVSVPSALGGRFSVDADRSMALSAYVTALLEHAEATRDCSPCPSDRYT